MGEKKLSDMLKTPNTSPNKAKKRMWTALMVVSAIAFIFCSVYVGSYYVSAYNYDKEMEEQAELIAKLREEAAKATKAPVKPTKKPENVVIQPSEKPKEVLPEYAELVKKNEDTVGYLEIADTNIKYPVVQGKDNDFYLRRNFKKKKETRGVIFLDYRNSIEEENTNRILYGHHMRDGTMFGTLERYKDEAFYKKHKYITFDTIYEHAKYEVIAAFYSRVYSEFDKVFKYYYFFDAKTKEEFDEFYESIKYQSLYDTGLEAKFGDTFITLSTCNKDYDVEGRFAVIAKRIE